MTKVTTLDLTPFYRNTLGVDRLFDRIVSQLDHASISQTNYPPFNIVETGENTTELQLAVAGFTQGEIEITVKDGELTIIGEKITRELPEGHVYKHQGISAKKFVRSWPMGDYVEVRGATVKDGILTVMLERIVPDSAKPKTIAITYET